MPIWSPGRHIPTQKIPKCPPRMYGHAPLLMGIDNNYSGHYKVRRRLSVNKRFVKLTLSGKRLSIKNGPDKIWILSIFGVMLRNMTWSIKHLVKRSLYLGQTIIICVLWWLLGFQRKKITLVLLNHVFVVLSRGPFQINFKVRVGVFLNDETDLTLTIHFHVPNTE